MSHWEKKANGWVFISHASEDYEDVRVVRNYLEDRGFSALMFYLKSLEHESRKEQIKKLIGWEISARNIFVLCNSIHAQNSEWVQWESDYVKALPNKIYKTIDIVAFTDGKESELKKLDYLTKKATIYLSYTHKDKDKVDKISAHLNSLGYKVYDGSTALEGGDDIEEVMEQALSEAARNGVVLMFLSENAKRSKWFWDEKSRALHSGASIIPVVIDDVGIRDFPALRDKQFIDASKGLSDSILQLIEKEINYIDV
ncbi:MAG: hypothetical protein B6D72_10455 [gamma proteobacterium symbiont of Ctena orbiculata]|nr:MAG: hypothetical protein DBP00_02850 [gamma proteobacterium symbiont of Ctena orbiculata]PVV11180.1 MAG: hypothetical protein B6D72_10455 [gamma proteobacterium symbiont of Ctena orbiculata]PVV22650.1 MAG: hypothetical protein B6D74_09350 [gamma proteobacterium symbiont of Ctena orbiculata]